MPAWWDLSPWGLTAALERDSPGARAVRIAHQRIEFYRKLANRDPEHRVFLQAWLILLASVRVRARASSGKIRSTRSSNRSTGERVRAERTNKLPSGNRIQAVTKESLRPPGKSAIASPPGNLLHQAGEPGCCAGWWGRVDRYAGRLEKGPGSRKFCLRRRCD
jgi:hypothetical protein